MRRVLIAAQVEAAAQEGSKEVVVPDGTIVTPLAKDRAAALGVSLVGSPLSVAAAETPLRGGGTRSSGRRAGARVDVERLALESKVRILARQALLRRRGGLAQLEDVVAAVLLRLAEQEGANPSCGCDGGQ